MSFVFVTGSSYTKSVVGIFCNLCKKFETKTVGIWRNLKINLSKRNTFARATWIVELEIEGPKITKDFLCSLASRALHRKEALWKICTICQFEKEEGQNQRTGKLLITERFQNKEQFK